MSAVRRRLALLLVSIALAGCAGRSSHTDVALLSGSPPEDTITRVISVWRAELCRYIAREGSGDPAQLLALGTLRSPDALRPGRITFGVLDAVTDPIPGYGWDAQGVLVGRQAGRGYTRYVFVVGILERARYAATRLQDVRLIGLVVRDGTLSWEAGEAQPEALRRYRESYRSAIAQRFPAEDDSFRMNASRDHVTVAELRSAAVWTLASSPREDGSGTAVALPVLRVAPASAADRCLST